MGRATAGQFGQEEPEAVTHELYFRPERRCFPYKSALEAVTSVVLQSSRAATKVDLLTYHTGVTYRLLCRIRDRNAKWKGARPGCFRQRGVIVLSVPEFGESGLSPAMPCICLFGLAKFEMPDLVWLYSSTATLCKMKPGGAVQSRSNAEIWDTYDVHAPN